jgi:hypothetical protein
MNPLVSPLFSAILSDYPWTVPAVGTGIIVACAAFLWGRRFLAPRPAARFLSRSPIARPALSPAMDVFLHGSMSERRGTPRRKGNSVEVLLTEHPDEPPVHGWVLDRSLGGLCVLVEHPLEKQVPMFVRPRQCPATTPWTNVGVLSCRAEQEGWKVHCRFDRTPDYNVLLLFG